MEQRKGKKIGLWIGGALVLALLCFVAIWFATAEKRNERMLQEYAYSWNMRCPTPMGRDMLLDRVIVLPDRIVVYQISSTTLTKKLYEEMLSVDEFRENVRRKAIDDLLNQPSLEQVKRLRITFRYNYKDVDGFPLMEFDITPEDYE